MAYFAVTYHYDPHDPGKREQFLGEHRRFLRGLHGRGLLVASGPLVDAPEPAGLLIFQAESAAGIRKVLTEDPFQKAGYVLEADVREWDPVIGVFAQE